LTPRTPRAARPSANVGFIEPNRHTIVRRDKYLAFTVGANDVEKLIAFVNIDGVVAVRTDVLVLREEGLF